LKSFAVFFGAGGSVGSGVGPSAFHPPKYFSMMLRASAGSMSPMIVIAVRSGLNVVS
jgi:hypothetical protein